MNQSPQILDYMRRNTAGLPQDSKLRLDVTPFGLTITLPPESLWKTLPQIFVAMMFFGISGMVSVSGIYGPRIYVGIGSLVLIGLTILFETIRRRRIPSAIALAEGKLVVLSPDQFIVRKEYLIHEKLAVRAKNLGVYLTGIPKARLEIYSSNPLFPSALVFAKLARPEIDWVANVINHAIQSSLPV